ncbi:hypothetical protein MMAG44476_30421 [Mycolicibacterium mageritense DSM 44476 = CIP 104973]|uniref:Cold-shock protein n=1 Tax=Mycolicibacterium mageritense TaxID=53462 RepID=A0ABM7HMB2_MYCME|nr:cold-shock protein [Mycolicibacterium mageritense]MCC9183928.1 cold-shock protein [Mycolicibacterium mageritense]BBX31651.1 hypothetical protein MMAGJ_09330 [Mycolicibacterium mageritense]CDO23798.1 hypothetical protein BN978_04287 [Mycolicibacterium mageritense DSM 44476 = CIP 104973]
MAEGNVTWFDHEKGFGIISPRMIRNRTDIGLSIAKQRASYADSHVDLAPAECLSTVGHGK